MQPMVQKWSQILITDLNTGFRIYMFSNDLFISMNRYKNYLKISLCSEVEESAVDLEERNNDSFNQK